VPLPLDHELCRRLPQRSESDQGHRQDQGNDRQALPVSPASTPPNMAATASDALLDQRALSKLRWRCRRGLLENDLFIEKFFARHETSLTVRQAEALGVLMDLSDNDLLDLLLGRKQPQDALAQDDVVQQVLGMLRAAPQPVQDLP